MLLFVLIIATCVLLEREYLLRWARWRWQRPVMDARDYARFQLRLDHWRKSKPLR